MAKKPNRTPNGRFYQVPASVYESEAYRSLNMPAFMVWHLLMEQHNGKNNGRLCALQSQLCRNGFSKNSLYKGLHELIEKGLVTREYKGGISPAGRNPSRYGLTHLNVVTLLEGEVENAPR